MTSNPRTAPGRRRSARRTVVLATAALGATALAVGLALPASAEPVNQTAYVAVGSDTIQYVDNNAFMNIPGNPLVSYDAVNPTNNGTYDYIQTKPGYLPFQRPASSGDGFSALRASHGSGATGASAASGDGGVAWKSEPMSTGSVDFSRASSVQAAHNGTDTTLDTYLNIPYAIDGISFALASNSDIPAKFQDEFSVQNLIDLYHNGLRVTLTNTHASLASDGSTIPADGTSITLHVVGAGVSGGPGDATVAGDVQVQTFIPKAGSGTRKDFLKFVGFTATNENAANSYPNQPWLRDFTDINGDGNGFLYDGGSFDTDPGKANCPAASGTNPLRWNGTACVSDFTYDPGEQLEEHDGTVLAANSNGIYPFSIGQWLTQSKSTLAISGTANGGFTEVGSPTSGSVTFAKDRRHGAVIEPLAATTGGTPIYPLTNQNNTGTLHVTTGVSDPGYPFLRVTYHVAKISDLFTTATSQSNLPATITTATLKPLGKLLISTDSTHLSSLCKQGTSITPYGLKVADSTNNTINSDFCGQVDNNLTGTP